MNAEIIRELKELKEENERLKLQHKQDDETLVKAGIDFEKMQHKLDKQASKIKHRVADIVSLTQEIKKLKSELDYYYQLDLPANSKILRYNEDSIACSECGHGNASGILEDGECTFKCSNCGGPMVHATEIIVKN